MPQAIDCSALGRVAGYERIGNCADAVECDV